MHLGIFYVISWWTALDAGAIVKAIVACDLWWNGFAYPTGKPESFQEVSPTYQPRTAIQTDIAEMLFWILINDFITSSTKITQKQSDKQYTIKQFQIFEILQMFRFFATSHPLLSFKNIHKCTYIPGNRGTEPMMPWPYSSTSCSWHSCRPWSAWA